MPSAMPTATARLASSALQVPPTQNTAQVIEFNCLYTHDLRRKSKRWQDGFLRLHTFNARALVYDEQRNLVGDTHLTDGRELEDGDEIKLDKGGVLVQVADRRGESTTDITGVCKQKVTTNPASSSPLRLPEINVTPRGDRQPLQEKHRSLNALLGSSRKPLGKAVLPTRSPFELRQEERENFPDRETAKRRRISRSDDASSRKSAQLQARAYERHARAQTSTRETSARIDLTADDDHTPAFSSIVPTPATQMPTIRPPATVRKAPADQAAQSKRVDLERNGKRLSLAKTNARRNILACQTITQPQTIEEQQRQRLVARLARVEQRSHGAGEQTRTARSPTPPAMPPPSKPVTKRASSHASSPEAQARPAATALPSSFEDIDITDAAIETLLEAEIIREPLLDHEDVDFSGFDDSIDDELEQLATSSTIAQEDQVEMQEALFEPVVLEESRPVVAGTHGNEQLRDEDDGHEHDGQQPNAELQPASSFTPIAVEVEQPMLVVDPPDILEPAPANEQPEAAVPAILPKKTPIRRSKRVGRIEVRKSAAACFKPPTLSTRISSGPLQLPTDSPACLSTSMKGPWSREAFDLFTWRPPGWNEGEWRIDAKPDIVQ